MSKKKKVDLVNLAIFFIFLFSLRIFFCFCQNTKLKVEGNINIHQNQTLRFTPVPYNETTPPSNPSGGDLYFNGTALLYYNGTGWQTIAQEGDIFFNREDNTLYYYNGEKWKAVKGGGKKTVATRIVAAYNSLGSTLEDGITSCPGDGTPCFNSKADYTCDGVDDQMEIQKAIDDLGTDGGVVYLLEGNYTISFPIVLERTSDANPGDSNKSLIGTGAATVLKGGSIQQVIHIKGYSSAENDYPISHIHITQLRIKGSAGSTYYGIKLKLAQESIINKVWIEGNISGIKLEESSSSNIISSNYITSTGNYLLFLENGSSNNIISSNILENGSEGGIQVASATNNSENNIVLGNIIRSGGKGIVIESDNSYNIVLANNIFQRSRGIEIYSDYNLISSNIVLNCTDCGIQLNGGNYNLITSNNIQDTSKEGILFTPGTASSYNNIYGNLIYNSDNDGIEVNGSSNLLSSNRILGSGGNEINLASGDANYLVGNYVNGTITDLGTNTTYTQKEKVTIERTKFFVCDKTALLNELTPCPRGYVVFDTGGDDIQLGDPAIVDGKAVGDTLILEGPASGSVTIPDHANTLLGGDIVLRAEDTLTLLWNGSDWLKIDYSNN